MIIESLALYKSNENYTDNAASIELSELSDSQLFILYSILVAYVFITLYVAIKYPIGGNSLLSIIMAMFFSTLFWITKLIEVLFFSLEKAKKSKKSKKSNYYDRIY